MICDKLIHTRHGVRFEIKVGQIGSKWDKSVTFSDLISVHFGSPSQNVLKSVLKKLGETKCTEI